MASHEKHDPCIRMTRRGFDSSRKRIVVAEPYDPQETVRADAQNSRSVPSLLFPRGAAIVCIFVLLAYYNWHLLFCILCASRWNNSLQILVHPPQLPAEQSMEQRSRDACFWPRRQQRWQLVRLQKLLKI